MAKLSKEEVEQIIERDLPNYQVVEGSLNREEADSSDLARFRDSSGQRSNSDATSPNLDTLREKLRRQGRSGGSSRSTTFRTRDSNEFYLISDDVQTGGLENAADDATDDVIVAVRPKKTRSPFDAGYRTKAVVISGRSKRVIGRQG